MSGFLRSLLAVSMVMCLFFSRGFVSLADAPVAPATATPATFWDYGPANPGNPYYRAFLTLLQAAGIVFVSGSECFAEELVTEWETWASNLTGSWGDSFREWALGRSGWLMEDALDGITSVAYPGSDGLPYTLITVNGKNYMQFPAGSGYPSGHHFELFPPAGASYTSSYIVCNYYTMGTRQTSAAIGIHRFYPGSSQFLNGYVTGGYCFASCATPYTGDGDDALSHWLAYYYGSSWTDSSWWEITTDFDGWFSLGVDATLKTSAGDVAATWALKADSPLWDTIPDFDVPAVTSEISPTLLYVVPADSYEDLIGLDQADLIAGDVYYVTDSPVYILPTVAPGGVDPGAIDVGWLERFDLVTGWLDGWIADLFLPPAEYADQLDAVLADMETRFPLAYLGILGDTVDIFFPVEVADPEFVITIPLPVFGDWVLDLEPPSGMQTLFRTISAWGVWGLFVEYLMTRGREVLAR